MCLVDEYILNYMILVISINHPNHISKSILILFSLSLFSYRPYSIEIAWNRMNKYIQFNQFNQFTQNIKYTVIGIIEISEIQNSIIKALVTSDPCYTKNFNVNGNDSEILQT